VPTVDGQWNNAIGRLAAFDALTLRQIWVDDDNVNFAKFNAPTIAAGKVIRATFSDRVVVYGLRSQGFPVWRYTGTPCTGESCPGWQRLDNNPKTIAIASGGGHYTRPRHGAHKQISEGAAHFKRARVLK
jgi:hypothetical protein